MAGNIVYLDAESWSVVSLKEVGAHVYCEHESTRPILWGALCDEQQERAFCFEEPNPFRILEELRRARRLKWGKRKNPLIVFHWTPFDRMLAQSIWPAGWEESPELYGVRGPMNTLWVDLAELALTAGLPYGLAAASAFVGRETKDAGKKLIDLFCGPTPCDPHDHPVQWAEFKAYCAQDVQAMRPIWHALREAGVDPGEHADRAWAVRKMNDRGVKVDVDSARYVLSALDVAQEAAEQEVFDRYGFRTTQVKKLTEFLGTPNAQVETIEAALEAWEFDEDQRFVAETRVGLAGAARKKLKPLVKRAGEACGHRVRGGFLYHGAWTGRLSSLGVQFQNFVRSPSDPTFFTRLREWPVSELFAQTRANIRGFLISEEDSLLVGSDYSAIELRVGAWLANESWLLDAFDSGVDPYRIQASAQFNTPLEAVTSDQRQYGKVVELAAMYGQGPHGFQKRRALEGDDLPYERCVHSISTFRRTHPAFTAAWKECDTALRRIVRSPAGRRIEALGGRVFFDRYPNSVTIVRPSEATQVLWMPSIVEGQWPDGEPREEIQIVAKDAQTGYMQWARTYGANVFQNLVQGIAFDLMIEALVRVEQARLQPVLSIHDEIVCEAGEHEVNRTKDRLESIMTEIDSSNWAAGIPIRVESWVSRRFTKA